MEDTRSLHWAVDWMSLRKRDRENRGLLRMEMISSVSLVPVWRSTVHREMARDCTRRMLSVLEREGVVSVEGMFGVGEGRWGEGGEDDGGEDVFWRGEGCC